MLVQQQIATLICVEVKIQSKIQLNKEHSKIVIHIKSVCVCVCVCVGGGGGGGGVTWRTEQMVTFRLDCLKPRLFHAHRTLNVKYSEGYVIFP